MKQIYLVNKSKAVLGLFSGVKSRITLTQPLFKHYCVLTVALMLLLGGFSTRVLGADPVACKYINNQQKDINAYNNRTTGKLIKTYYYKFHQYENITSLSAADNKYGVSAISCSVNIDALWGGMGQGATVLLQYKVGTGAWTNVGTAQTCAADGGAKSFSVSGLSIAKNQEVAFRLNVTSYNDNEYTKQRKLTAYLTVSMSKTLSLNSTADMEFSDLVYGTTPNPEDTRTVTFSCESTQKTMSVSCDNNTDFTVALNNTSLGADCDGTRTVTVTFHPQTVGDKSGTVTISSTNGAASTSFDVKGKCTPATPTLILSQTTATIDKTSDVLHPNNFDILSAITTYVGDGKHYDIVASDISSNGHINGDNFYATEPGTYTIRITSPAGDHYGNTFSDNATYRDIVVTVRDKAHPSFNKNYTQETANGLLVDGIIESAFVLENVSVAAGFTWNITHNINSVNNGDGMVIEYDAEKNKIIAHNAGTASLQFVQTGDDDYYDGESEVYTFIVSKHETSFSGSAYNMMIDATQTADYSYTNVSDTKPTASDEDNFYYTIDEVSFTKEAKNNGTNLVTFNPNNKLITACNAGTAKITLHQKETYKYTGATTSFNVAVYKYNSVFANVDDKSVKVGADVASTYSLTYAKPNAAYIETTAPSAAGTPVLGESTNFYYTLTQNVTTDKTTGSPDPSLAITYNAGTKTATGKNAGTGTIHLYQPETYKYNAADEDFVVTVTKNGNALSCKFDNVTSTTWKKTLNFDEYTVATFSSNHTMNAIQVALKAGDSIASYNPSNGRITSYGNVGDAIWTVWQPENYMYVGDTAECKVTVSRKACPTCYVYEGYIDDNSKTVGETWNDNPTIASWSEDGVANQLTFSMAVNGAGNNAQFARYVSGTWSSDSTLKTSGYHGITIQTYDDHSVALNAHTTQVRFMKKNTDNPYIKDIRVSRRKWFTIEDLNGNALSQIEMKNYVGGNSTTAQFRVNFSTCDKEVKVISNHPHVTVSYDPINLDNSKGGSGIRTITITYACDVAERINTTISVYTKYEQADLRVIATTELEDQVINWNSDYVSGKSASLPVSFKSNDMATASSDLDVKYITTTPDIIDISADSTIIQVIKEGENGVLIAYQAGNDVFKPISDTITVHATNKKIQTIVWSQSFTRNLTLDSVCDLTAKVYITNLLNGSQTYSPERTAKLHYACTGAAGVVTVNDDARTMRIVNYGTTKITATVEDDDDDYELALPVEKQVKVRQLSSGECDGDEPIYANGDKLDLFYLDVSLGNLNTIGMTLAKPEVERSIEIDLSKGVPDSLKCYVHAVPFTISNTSLSRLAGHVEVYTSADNGITWSQKLGTFNPASGDSAICAIAIDRNVNRIKFYRPQGGEGHHYIEDIVVTRKQFIEAENINLGNVAAGAVRKDSILVNYSDARQDFNVTRGLANTKNKLILEDDKMYVSCGETDQQKLPFEFKPKVVGDWRDTVTITDPKTGKTAIVILTATITRGNQVIKWNADTEIDAGEHAPSLNGYSTAGEDYPVSYAITAGSDVAVIREINGVDSVIVKKSGTFTITATQPGDDNFYPAEPVVKTFHVASVAYTYNGDGDWSDDDNWSTKEVPEDGVDVVINGNVTIEDTISVNSLTINEGSEVTLAVGGQLTIGDGDSKTQATYGNLHVETDGQVILNGGELKVNNFILDAALGDVADETQFGVSGQVTNPTNLAIITNAYFDLTVDPDGQVTFGWYDFTVPFNVNIAEGIYRLKDDGSMTKLKSGKDFIIARYDEPTRATGKKGWVTVNGGSLHAGETYTITLDDEVTQNVLRFVWDKSSSLGTSYSRPVSYTAPATKNGTSTSGWNGLGNGTLTHTQLQSLPAKAKVQMYDHNAKAYVPVSADKFTYAVGTSFFYQVKNTDPVVLTSAQEDENHPLRAPQRDARETEEFRLTLTAENSTRTADVMYVSASEDAETEYMVGRDLMKVANPKEATVAQMWASKGDNILCDIEMPLESNYATTPLVLYTPKDGQYVLEVKEAPEDAMLYLTYEGRAIWNLSYSPYVFDLAKGTTEGYGLKLYANPAPQVATGVDDLDAEAQTMRKVMIDNVLYIITPDGAMYDVTGKSVK